MFIISNEPTNGGIDITNLMGFSCSRTENKITFCRYDYERYPDYSWIYPDKKSMLLDYAKIIREIKLYQEKYTSITQKVESCS